MDIVRVNYPSLVMGSNKPRKINSISKAKKDSIVTLGCREKLFPS